MKAHRWSPTWDFSRKISLAHTYGSQVEISSSVWSTQVVPSCWSGLWILFAALFRAGQRLEIENGISRWVPSESHDTTTHRGFRSTTVRRDVNTVRVNPFPQQNLVIVGWSSHHCHLLLHKKTQSQTQQHSMGHQSTFTGIQNHVLHICWWIDDSWCIPSWK